MAPAWHSKIIKTLMDWRPTPDNSQPPPKTWPSQPLPPNRESQPQPNEWWQPHTSGGQPASNVGNTSNAYGNASNAYGSTSNAYGNASNAYSNTGNAYGNTGNAYGNTCNAYGDASKESRPWSSATGLVYGPAITDPTMDSIFELDGTTFHILGTAADVVVRQMTPRGPIVAGRVHVKVRVVASPFPQTGLTADATSRGLRLPPPSPQRTMTIAAHGMIWPSTAPGMPTCHKIILDTETLREWRRHTEGTPFFVGHADVYNTHPHPHPPHMLESLWSGYIIAVRTSGDLQEFCQAELKHNYRNKKLEEYGLVVRRVYEAVRDIGYLPVELALDGPRGIVAALVRYVGTATGELFEVIPDYGVGKVVDFEEIIFLWFERDKIHSVVSISDVDAYRAQVTS